MTKSQQITAILNKGNIRTREVDVIGQYVHIDTFAKYETDLRHVMSGAGFAVVMVRDGMHMDGTEGFRMVFKAG